MYFGDPNVADIVAPEPFVMPDWIRPGAFARTQIGSDERIVEIDRIEPQESVCYVWVQPWQRMETWSPATEPLAPIRNDIFARLWESCERPADPRTAWERLLGDEPF